MCLEWLSLTVFLIMVLPLLLMGQQLVLKDLAVVVFVEFADVAIVKHKYQLWWPSGRNDDDSDWLRAHVCVSTALLWWRSYKCLLCFSLKSMLHSEGVSTDTHRSCVWRKNKEFRKRKTLRTREALCTWTNHFASSGLVVWVPELTYHVVHQNWCLLG